jgi:hypothetical protein
MWSLRRILREAEGESKFWRSKQRKAGDLEGAAKVWTEKAGEPEIAGERDGENGRKLQKIVAAAPPVTNTVLSLL